MFKIIEKKELCKDVTQIKIEAPLIAQKAKAGQFISLIIEEEGERIPLTLANWDVNEGSITLIFQKVGFTTKKLGKLKKGNTIKHILGPLGHPTNIDNFGTVVCMGGGVGIAEILPIIQAFKDAKSRVISIIGARSKELLILKNEIEQISDECFITTDDGSLGKKGNVGDILKELLSVIEKSTHTKYPDLVYTVGPIPMMKAVAEITRSYKIKTIASVNPIMVDATGMCGACRCTVAGKTKFGCVDGPDFDAHELDFEELSKRLATFKAQEKSVSNNV